MQQAAAGGAGAVWIRPLAPPLAKSTQRRGHAPLGPAWLITNGETGREHFHSEQRRLKERVSIKARSRALINEAKSFRYGSVIVSADHPAESVFPLRTLFL